MFKTVKVALRSVVEFFGFLRDQVATRKTRKKKKLIKQSEKRRQRARKRAKKATGGP